MPIVLFVIQYMIKGIAKNPSSELFHKKWGSDIVKRILDKTYEWDIDFVPTISSLD